MTITAKYRSTCSRCRRTIRVGEQIEWVKGGPPTYHTACATTPEPPYNSPPPRDFSQLDPVAEAARFGRTAVPGAAVETFARYGLATGHDGDADGSLHLVRGVRYLQIARTRRQYLSQKWLEDMDMFSAEPGGSYSWAGVAVELDAEDQQAAEDKREQAAEVERERAAVRSGATPIEAHYYDGEYLSGWMPSKGSAELLERLGMAHYVDGWGVHITDRELQELLARRAE